MKTIKVIRKLKPRSRALIDLMLEHGDANGYLDMNALDQVKPDWDREFPSRIWASTQASQLRASGRFDWEKKRKLGMVGDGKPLSDRYQVALDIYSKYRLPTGIVNWKGAFKEHPEWKTLLGVNPSTIITGLVSRGFITRGQPGAAANGSHTTERIPTPAPVVVPEFTDEQLLKIDKIYRKRFAEAVEYVLGEAAFCSKCGNNIGQQIRTAAAKLTTTQG